MLLCFSLFFFSLIDGYDAAQRLVSYAVRYSRWVRVLYFLLVGVGALSILWALHQRRSKEQSSIDGLIAWPARSKTTQDVTKKVSCKTITIPTHHRNQDLLPPLKTSLRWSIGTSSCLYLGVLSYSSPRGALVPSIILGYPTHLVCRRSTTKVPWHILSMNIMWRERGKGNLY